MTIARRSRAYATTIIVIFLASVAATSALLAQAAPKAVTTNIANDPDVLGAERLFSAWMEGQIAYRGLPGIAVGVVSDQELVWATGFGFADLKAKMPMTPATKFRMASHSKLFTAIAIMQLREQGKLRLDDPVVKYLPWFKAKPAGDDDGPDHHRATPLAQLGHAARGRRSLDVVRVPDRRRAPTPLRRSAGRVRAVGAVEVLQPRLHRRRHGHRAGERRAVGRLRRSRTSSSRSA